MTAKQTQQQVRIIGGKWRGRKITFTAKDIRPTSDRVRETLFNWLAPYICDAVCLDMFAGSGALGFEALSRGAKHLTLIDLSPIVIRDLKIMAARLDAANVVTFFQIKMPDTLPMTPAMYDIVFVDPPFFQQLTVKSCEWLEKSTLIHDQSLIYVETEKKMRLDATGIGLNKFKILKQGCTAQVNYYLIQKHHQT
jgi:16S rRNA (guanine966-N2)-methyltransferase